MYTHCHILNTAKVCKIIILRKSILFSSFIAFKHATRQKVKTLQLIKCDLIVRHIFAPNTNTSIYNAIRCTDTIFFENATESAYEELKIKNVSLTFELQTYVEKLNLDQRLFINKTKDKQLIELQERSELIQTCFENLSGQKHYNDIFHFVAKLIMKNLRIVKKHLKRR